MSSVDQQTSGGTVVSEVMCTRFPCQTTSGTLYLSEEKKKISGTFCLVKLIGFKRFSSVVAKGQCVNQNNAGTVTVTNDYRGKKFSSL